MKGVGYSELVTEEIEDGVDIGPVFPSSSTKLWQATTVQASSEVLDSMD